MTDRQLIAYGIVLLFLLAGAVALRRRSRWRRGGRSAEPHLRIDLIQDAGEPPPKP